MILGDFKRL